MHPNMNQLENILTNRFDNQFILGISISRFDQSLDILNYADKLESSKPKEAIINSYYLGYQFDKWKLSFESNKSSGEVKGYLSPNLLKLMLILKLLLFLMMC